MPQQPTLDDLASVEENKQLKAQYCYCVDHKNWQRLGSLFTPDARVNESGHTVTIDPVTKERIPIAGFSFEFIDKTFNNFNWPLVGPECVRLFGESVAANNRTVRHVFVPEIELTSGTTTEGTWPMEGYA